MPDQGFATIWLDHSDPAVVCIIDQRRLPHEICVARLSTWQDGLAAIRDMAVRGAPLIGATAAYSLYLAARARRDAATVREAAAALIEARPTAVNLRWSVGRILRLADTTPADADLAAVILADAEAICAEDADICRGIGRHGLTLLERIARTKGTAPVNVLTHCNAGALATTGLGTATAPIYLAHEAGLAVHVWVDETRPRNQGALTAWELARYGVPHTLVVDNAGGHLMQHGLVDVVITGTDRTTRAGDVANKIGTYLKAAAARDNGVPFYVAVPSTSIDWDLGDGLDGIPIEERDPEEVSNVVGQADHGPSAVRITAVDTPVRNVAFDVTPARLVTGLITERGVCPASEAGLAGLFPEKIGHAG
jgi:methylthioribose-1-phosphate isomerase